MAELGVGQGDHSPWGSGYDDESGRSWLFHPLVMAMLALAFFAVGFFAFLYFDSRGDDAVTSAAGPSADATIDDAGHDAVSGPADAVATGDDGSAGADGGGAAGDGTAAGETTATTLALPEAPTEGTYVEATLNLDAGPGPGMFKLSGRVPDQEMADALLASAELSYAPFVKSELMVDETLDPAPWLEAGPRLIGLLPMVTDGSMRLVDGRVELAARSPNPQYLAIFEGALDQLGGMPVEVVDSEITDLVPPSFTASVDDGTITLSGEVPSDAVETLLLGGAAAAYGEDNVVDELDIDDGTYTSFWMYTMPGVFQLLSAFPTYEISVIDAIFSGSLQGGVTFPIDSTEITPEATQLLNVGVAIMARDISIAMTVEGHTDSTGSAEYNQLLSDARARSVVDYFVAAGIDEGRLTAIGAGESEPIAPNDTDEGMAANRRVEFEFGPLGGG
ncbi:MAG: OmpA family protein [Acidimicrobiales bacterium]